MWSSMRLRRISPRPARHRRRDHRVHEHAGVEQLAGEHHRRHLVALPQRDGDDRALGRVHRHAALGEQADEEVDVGAQLLRSSRASSRRMRSASSAAATEPGVFDAVKISGSASSVSSSIASARADERAAARAERLRERDRDEVDVVEHAVVLGRAAARARRARRGRGLRRRGGTCWGSWPQSSTISAERRGVAAHRVDAVDDDALARLGRELAEDLGEALEVVVPEALHRRARELRAGERASCGRPCRARRSRGGGGGR